jgi:formyltetrahydrofolate deformylase
MYILCLTCKDRPGIVAAVAGALSKNGCNIEESSQFNDPMSGLFYMRVVYSSPEEKQATAFAKEFHKLAQTFSMEWNIADQTKPVKTLLLVSQHDHCLHHLLYQWTTSHLPIEITGVISNHPDAQKLVEHYDLPFHHLPVNKTSKDEQEAQIDKIIEETDSELIILARYMQILSSSFIEKYEWRVINIHHSFLPGFKGAKPYHQAYARGVKIIGATAHFATADLDEGPIIEQAVVPVDHTMTPQKMQLLGRDTESITLARAIRLYAERRIFTHERRTVIL